MQSVMVLVLLPSWPEFNAKRVKIWVDFTIYALLLSALKWIGIINDFHLTDILAET